MRCFFGKSDDISCDDLVSQHVRVKFMEEVIPGKNDWTGNSLEDGAAVSSSTVNDWVTQNGQHS